MLKETRPKPIRLRLRWAKLENIFDIVGCVGKFCYFEQKISLTSDVIRLLSGIILGCFSQGRGASSAFEVRVRGNLKALFAIPSGLFSRTEK
ncbi:hypothetical protein BVY02_00575 [bacterium J17]|nr:hypothetical protein BVY02_00575 [bacterium J17]